MDKIRVLDRAVRELLPIILEVLCAVVQAQLNDDRGVDAASPELLEAGSLELAGSEDHQVEGPPALVGGQVRLLPRPGLRPLLVDQLRLEAAAAYRVPAPQVLPFAEQLREADVQRVLDAVDERLYRNSSISFVMDASTAVTASATHPSPSGGAGTVSADLAGSAAASAGRPSCSSSRS
ncbi:MAG TPA: hypothetical protein VFQ68_12150 [Streptosporangiaceae bacterium]|nr:hypothetical protein [Streptosporangiaceae bacterium]